MISSIKNPIRATKKTTTAIDHFIKYELYLDNQKTLMNIHKSSYGEITKKI